MAISLRPAFMKPTESIDFTAWLAALHCSNKLVNTGFELYAVFKCQDIGIIVWKIVKCFYHRRSGNHHNFLYTLLIIKKGVYSIMRSERLILRRETLFPTIKIKSQVAWYCL